MKPGFDSEAVDSEAFDLEAFDSEAVGLEASDLEASDIAFVVSNQDHIGHESGAYLDYRASMQSPLLRICLQINLNFNLKPYILNILDYIITKSPHGLVKSKSTTLIEYAYDKRT